MDWLTGLFNRSFMEESLELEIRRAVRSQLPLSVVMLALDDFLEFVEQRGIDTGDSLLRDVGALLQSNVRKGDIVCRYSGHAFVLVLPQGNFEISQKRSEDLREQIYTSGWNDPIKEDRKVTASVGLAVFPGHGQTVDALLRSAEAALNRAWGSGGNLVVIAN